MPLILSYIHTWYVAKVQKPCLVHISIISFREAEIIETLESRLSLPMYPSPLFHPKVYFTSLVIIHAKKKISGFQFQTRWITHAHRFTGPFSIITPENQLVKVTHLHIFVATKFILLFTIICSTEAFYLFIQLLVSIFFRLSLSRIFISWSCWWCFVQNYLDD